MGTAVGAVYEGVNKLEASNIPLLASQQGGVAERLKKVAKHPLTRGRGGFPIENKRKTTPAASASVATRNSFDDAALPSLFEAARCRACAPRRWCKEGNVPASSSFTPSMSAHTFARKSCKETKQCL